LESTQGRISFHKRKGVVHRRKAGAEAMIKIQKEFENDTLRDVYLASQQRSHRRQREVKKMVRASEVLRQHTRPAMGVKRGSISLYSSHSSAIGRLFKVIS